MLKLNNIFSFAKNAATSIINCQQTRNTFILRRRYQPLLNKKCSKSKKLTHKYFIYDMVECQSVKKQDPLKVILVKDTKGFGNKGDLIQLTPNKAYKYILLPRLGVYATPENIEKLKPNDTTQIVMTPASKITQLVSKILALRVFYVSMNRSEPWVLEPWHLRVSFRKAHLQVPEDAIEMPPEEIRGPDFTLENKIFCIGVTVSDTEKVNVRFKIQHYPVGITDDVAQVFEPLFPEQAETIAQLAQEQQKKKRTKFVVKKY